jgi:hypothetical protein
LLCKDLDPENLDYDNYWDNEVKGKIKDFVLLSKLEYLEILHENGFYTQITQGHLFD